MTKMKPKFIDCFLLMNSAMSLKAARRPVEMGRPLIQDQITTFINISLIIENIRVKDVKNMDLEIDYLLNQKWVDPRLSADENTRRLAVAGQIWRPKTTVINSIHQNCPKNEDSTFWRGYGEQGNILLSEKLTVQIRCTSKLENFPFDTQTCEMKLGTYKFPTEEVSYLWDEDSVDMRSNENIGDFKVLGLKSYTEQEIRPSGNFTIAVFKFSIRRLSTHYSYCIIIPSAIVTILNYLSIWLNLTRYFTRYSLNLFSFFFLLHMYYLSICSTIPVPYLKAIDKFVVMCMFFSILSLGETFILDLLSYIKEELGVRKRGWKKEFRKTISYIERIVKISYPVFYIFFLVLFSFYYLP